MSIMHTPETFWARVSIGAPDDCWPWQGAPTGGGYGVVSWHGVIVRAHRVAYWLSRGQIKLKTGFRLGKARTYKRFVLHECDNRICCNPKHLFLGSMRANLLGAYAKGRKVQPRSKHANAKVTADGVRAIRRLYIGGARQVDLAAKYKVSQRAISLIVRRETYKDIK